MNIFISYVVPTTASLMAILSALFAYYAWREAKRSNELSFLGQREFIQDELYELHMHITQKGKFSSKDEVGRFYYPMRNSRRYFRAKTSSKIKEYYNNCFVIADFAELSNQLSDDEVKIRDNALRKCREEYPELEREILETINKTTKGS